MVHVFSISKGNICIVQNRKLLTIGKLENTVGFKVCVCVRGKVCVCACARAHVYMVIRCLCFKKIMGDILL